MMNDNGKHGCVPTFLLCVTGIKFKTSEYLPKNIRFISLNITYIAFDMYSIEYTVGWKGFANHCIQFLFTFYTTSQLHCNWGLYTKPCLARNTKPVMHCSMPYNRLLKRTQWCSRRRFRWYLGCLLANGCTTQKTFVKSQSGRSLISSFSDFQRLHLL